MPKLAVVEVDSPRMGSVVSSIFSSFPVFFLQASSPLALRAAAVASGSHKVFFRTCSAGGTGWLATIVHRGIPTLGMM